MLISTKKGTVLFGPYAPADIEVLPEGISIYNSLLPFTVIGDYEFIDPLLPAGFVANEYTWTGSQLKQLPKE